MVAYRLGFLMAAFTYGIVVHRQHFVYGKLNGTTLQIAIKLLSDENVRYLGRNRPLISPSFCTSGMLMHNLLSVSLGSCMAVLSSSRPGPVPVRHIFGFPRSYLHPHHPAAYPAIW